MKAGWEVKALGEVCAKIQDGAHHSPKNSSPVRGPNMFPYVTSKNIRNWALDEDNVNYVDEAFHNSIYPRCNAEFGDVLLTKDGSNTGLVTLNTFDEPISLLSSVCLIKVAPEKLLSRYLVYYIQSDLGFENITGQMTGAAIKRIVLKRIKSSEIPLPPLEEQKRIVAVLDAAFEGLDRARTHIQTNLQNARELFDGVANALIVNADELEQVSLGDVSSIPSSLVDPKLPEFLDQPHVGAGNMETGRDILVDVKTSREEGLKSGKYTFDGSMVLYSKIRPYLKKVARPDFVGLCSADMYPLLPDADRLNKNFLFHLLLSEDFTEYAISGSDRAGMPKVNQTHLFKYTFGLPSLSIQAEIVAKVDATLDQSEQLQAQYRTKLADLDDLRQSLLQKAFAGELT